MFTYARVMRVSAVRRPYPGATGVQLDVDHPAGRVHAVYRDAPFALSILHDHPYLTEGDENGLFSYRTRDWWVYCRVRDGQSPFDRPDLALRGALHVAAEYIRNMGVPEPIELDRPITLEAAQKVIETYPALAAVAGGRRR